MDEDITDAPVEGSAFIRHYSYPYEKANEMRSTTCSVLVDEHIGFYKTSVSTKLFPWIESKNPVDIKLGKHASKIFNMVSNYEDLLYCRRLPDDHDIRLIYCAHALNHSLRARKLIVKNNEKEKRLGVSDALRDQGFHRARVLILAPTKEAARRVVHTFLSLMPKGSTVSHRKRFERDFGPQPGETDREKRRGRKPKDYEDWFSCNTGDHFRIGIAFAKRSVKLYSAFADSDLILASPLGLQSIIEEEEEKEADLQYITASTELLIIDQAEMLLMQNWSNVQNIVARINQRPTKAAFASAARIRLAYLAGYGKLYRQTLIFSAVAAPQITLLLGECENFQGLNYIPPSPHYPGVYPTFLPDHVRIPGLKNPQSMDLASTHPSKKPRLTTEATQTDSSTFPEVKLNLIPFAVFGQSADHAPPRLSALGSETDDEDEDNTDTVSNKQAAADPKTGSIHGASSSSQLIVYSGPLANETQTSLSGRAIPLARMNAFKQRVLPKLRRGLDQRVLIYVPDFYDLEELRLLLRAESLDFCCVHEYTEDKEAERYRTLFAEGRIRILLLSERYYFFRRRKIRGAQTFIFFGPPTFPWFLPELFQTRHVPDMSEEKDKAAAISLTMLYYPPFEAHLVATIVGKIDL